MYLGLDVYLWLEEMFHVLAHVLRESRFEELHNVGVHDERGFPKVAKEFMVDCFVGELFFDVCKFNGFCFCKLVMLCFNV